MDGLVLPLNPPPNHDVAQNNRDAEVGGDGRSLDEALGAAEGVDTVNATHAAAVGDGAI